MKVAEGWREALLRASEQGLADLACSGASDVVFLREGRGAPGPFFETALERAREQGFVTSSVTLSDERAFDALDLLVRELLRHLTLNGVDTGLVALLDAFAREKKKTHLALFDESAAAFDLAGELHDLSRSYLAAKNGPGRELRDLRAWIEGGEPKSTSEVFFRKLTERTAKRALNELSRLVRVLGHAGLVLVVRRASLLAELSAVRREAGYTVLRELVDNADGARGMISTRLYVSGGPELFEGPRSIETDGALSSRLEDPSRASAKAPLPHDALWSLVPESEEPVEVRAPRHPASRRAEALQDLIRTTRGLPPLGRLQSATVGYEEVNQTLTSLFELAQNQGSVFSLVVGAYGTGKTHLLLHAEERALSEGRPVFRLAVERMDIDLGNPQRHLAKLIEGAVLPLRGRPGPLQRLEAWLSTKALRKRFADALEEIAASDSDAKPQAEKARRWLEQGEDDAVFSFLGASDLTSKANGANYRQDAYGRLLLWLDLLIRIEKLDGPLFLIDEAENLYRGGTLRAERRTALRSLAFYCGGTLPRACVVLAVTPETLKELRHESKELTAEVNDQKTLLACEDATMLQRRINKGKPIEVRSLSSEELKLLSRRVRAIHDDARGTVDDPGFAAFVGHLLGTEPTPRQLVREVTRRLEEQWWRLQ